LQRCHALETAAPTHLQRGSSRENTGMTACVSRNVCGESPKWESLRRRSLRERQNQVRKRYSAAPSASNVGSRTRPRTVHGTGGAALDLADGVCERCT
jgi:hypothetical protein